MPRLPIEWLDTLTWLLFLGGFALVVASWAGRAGKRVGWIGAWMTITGGTMSWVEPPGFRVAILAAGAVAIALVAIPRRTRPKPWRPRRARRFTPWDQEAELLGLCHGDKALVERLIEHEKELNPKLSRAGAALSAATRLRHDK